MAKKKVTGKLIIVSESGKVYSVDPDGKGKIDLLDASSAIAASALDAKSTTTGAVTEITAAAEAKTEEDGVVAVIIMGRLVN